MVRYAGGKKRISKEVCDVIQHIEKELQQESNDYLEPFVGFGAVAIEMMKREIVNNQTKRNYILTELNPDIVAFWKGLKGKWIPPNKVTSELYDKLSQERNNQSKPSADRAYVGNAYSFNGHFFGSYRGNYQSPAITIKENETSFNEIMKMKEIVQTCKVKILKPQSYFDLDVDKMSKGKTLTIYCDPPYQASLKKMNSKFFSSFDVDKFWETMREWSKKHLVIISEDMEDIPEDFQRIWTKKVYRSVGNSKGYKIEGLFLHNTWIKQ